VQQPERLCSRRQYRYACDHDVQPLGLARPRRSPPHNTAESSMWRCPVTGRFLR
jgi:hypothetical protein